MSAQGFAGLALLLLGGAGFLVAQAKMEDALAALGDEARERALAALAGPRRLGYGAPVAVVGAFVALIYGSREAALGVALGTLAALAALVAAARWRVVGHLEGVPEDFQRTFRRWALVHMGASFCAFGGVGLFLLSAP